MAYARAQEQKMGKPQSQVKKDKPQKPPISRMWVCKCIHYQYYDMMADNLFMKTSYCSSYAVA
jgi:hypothetical protein